MKDRWRGRRAAGLAVVALLGAVIAGAARASDERASWLVVRDEAGVELVRVEVPASHEFSLRYRNSIYQSLAEEQFSLSDGRLTLVSLAAEELAVLEEYYGAFGASRSGSGWKVPVQRPPVDLPLRIQATALGERTLLVDDQELVLWQLVGGRDDTSVILSVEQGA